MTQLRRPKSDSRGYVTAAADEIDNWLSGTHTHGFNPQIGERQPLREGLLGSVQQARALRKEMAILRKHGHMALTKLTDKMTALEKSCGQKKLRV